MTFFHQCAVEKNRLQPVAHRAQCTGARYQPIVELCDKADDWCVVARETDGTEMCLPCVKGHLKYPGRNNLAIDIALPDTKRLYV